MGKVGSHFWKENLAIFQPIRCSRKRVGRYVSLCLKKVAASVTAKVSEISDTSTDGHRVTC